MNAFDFHLIIPGEDDAPLNIKEMAYGGNAVCANEDARNCFALRVRTEQFRIRCAILLGPADDMRGHARLVREYEARTEGMQNAGGGMIWTNTKNDQEVLYIGSYSVFCDSVPEKVIRLVQDSISSYIRSFGVVIDSVSICPMYNANRIWDAEPYSNLLV